MKKKNRPVQGSLQLVTKPQPPRNHSQSSAPAKTGIVDLNARRTKAFEAAKARLVAEVCDRAIHLADVLRKDT